MIERRINSLGRALKENETQKQDGTYSYRWKTSDGKRHAVYMERRLINLEKKKMQS